MTIRMQLFGKSSILCMCVCQLKRGYNWWKQAANYFGLHRKQTIQFCKEFMIKKKKNAAFNDDKCFNIDLEVNSSN